MSSSGDPTSFSSSSGDAPRTAAGSADGRSTRQERDITLSEIIRGKILEAIMRGSLRSGEIIRTAQLAEQFEVSRTPVREALNSLEQQGLVTVVPYRGYTVRPITLEDARDLYFMRTLIEGAAAERAATRLSSEQLDELSNIQAKSPLAHGSYSITYDDYSYCFHRAIAAAADSGRLLDSLDRLFQDVRRIRLIGASPPDPRRLYEEHQAIYEALQEQDPSQSRAMMEDHIESSRRQTIERLLG